MTTGNDQAGPAPLRPRSSLRFKLTVWMIAVWSTIQVTLGLVILLYERSALEGFFNVRLSTRAGDIAEEITGGLPALTDRDLQAIASRHAQYMMYERFHLALYAPDGSTLAASLRPSPRLADLRVPPPDRNGAPAAFRTSQGFGEAEARRAQPSLRAIVVGFDDSSLAGYRLLAATTDNYAKNILSQLHEVLIASMLAGLIGALVSGWFIAGITIRPFRRLALSMREITPGTVSRTMSVGGDETREFAETRRELDALRTRMEEGFLSQERFLSNVSHEIKTPISVLLTESQTLPPMDDAPQQVREFISSARDELRRLGGLVDSFLLLTRVRDGRPIKALVAPCMVNELLIDSMESCASMADQYSVKIIPTLLEDEDSLDLAVTGVPDLLRTMLDNIVRNAIRFSPEGSHIETSAARNGAMVRLFIRDYGPGIPAEIIERIFDRFSQAKTEERRGRGHGLGLAIAQGIAELHGGRISVENCPDRGCRFTVTLPIANPDLQDSVGGARR